MTTNQWETTANYRIEDQEPSDSPLTLEATPSGDRAYFCQLLHQKAEVLTFTFGVDGGDGPYTDIENQDAMFLAATTVLRAALTGNPLPTDKTLFFVDGRAYYLETVLLTGTPDTLELVRGALPPPGPEELKTKGRRLPAIPDIFKDGLLPIPVTHTTWAMLAAVQDSQEGRITAKWTDNDGETFPTHRTTFRKGRSAVDVSVRDGAGDGAPSAAALAAQWDKVHTMGDKAHLASDVLLVCLAHWATRSDGPRTPVTITADAILDARGIKRKKYHGEPDNWQHGHRQEERLDVARSLAHLESLWLEIRDVEIIPEGKPDKSGRRRKAQRVTFSSRALAILDKAHAVDFEGEAVFLAASVMPGKWAEEYWQRGLKYTGHLAAKALSYDPYRQAPEKGLAKFFAFHFAFDRTGNADTLPRRVGTLLEGAGISQDSRHPERTKKRFEKALDLLVEDGIIEAWEYQGGRPFLTPKGWLKTWLEWTVKTTPPENLGARPTFGARGESSHGQWRPLELAPFDD